MNKNTTILIFGAGSKVARETFKNLKSYNIIGFSRYSKISDIKEYPVLRYKNLNLIKKTIEKTKTKKIVLVFMETLSISNLVINKSETELLKEIKASLINPHNIVKKILPLMIKNRWGRVIFCGSSRALRTSAGISGYSSAKYASLGYCKTLSKEYASLGITSNYLSLGLFNSPMLKKVKKNDLINLLQNTDTKKIGDYNSVSNAINFIINSSYVTGSIIPIDGGFN